MLILVQNYFCRADEKFTGLQHLSFSCNQIGDNGTMVLVGSLSQLCWHNFRIIGMVLRRIGIENNAGILGEY